MDKIKIGFSLRCCGFGLNITSRDHIIFLYVCTNYKNCRICILETRIKKVGFI